MKRALLLSVLVFAGSAHAVELKLDQSWIPKLGQLCQAATYGSRMTAEPICNELGQVVARANAAEAAAKAEATKKPTATKEPAAAPAKP
ncbi:MAG TPA: hypothetical protein VKX28_26810 [Xanthobacteraceae bacterium]|nr:hypothetical protein [Xanthobacteraceae bacterium]